MQDKRHTFHRHYAMPGPVFYPLLFAYLILGWFYPVCGLLALICMLGPIVTSHWMGRYWCGHYCLRSNMYWHLLSRYSPHKPIPRVVRTRGFRVFMVVLIFSMFGVQMAFVESLGDAGRVFWRMILLTNIVGVTLAFIYAPYTWCSFCPMGTIAHWLAPKRGPLPTAFTCVSVSERCSQSCKTCARVCPLQLKPYEARGQRPGFTNPDCIKCGKCVSACPKKMIGWQRADATPQQA